MKIRPGMHKGGKVKRSGKLPELLAAKMPEGTIATSDKLLALDEPIASFIREAIPARDSQAHQACSGRGCPWEGMRTAGNDLPPESYRRTQAADSSPEAAAFAQGRRGHRPPELLDRDAPFGRKIGFRCRDIGR
ncbi:MAG: hypothetical protein EOS66_17935 [Mesorhizobium sp.]|nr:MAG: hypothetical protein EOS66_17935 [Mesorhizobium sp.]TIU56711.1 MAG: hypothetical protein E5W35_12255 [Mesorhizobium sp.]